jgi:Putative lumazine-binding
MKNLYLILLLIGSVFTARAQSAEEANVTEVVNNLFKAMYTNDTTLFKSVFADQVTMATAMKNREGKAVLQRESGIQGFVKAIARPNPNGALTEEIWNIKIQIDGDLAQVWCDYAFYVGNKFSHCGVDAFQLHKSADGWKIFHLADTRKRDNCSVPQNIQDKHK